MIIPEMTNELGNYWDQPNRNDIEIDEEIALMSVESLNKLKEYNTSIPSGVYEGKMWKTKHKNEYYLRWYDKIQEDHMLIETRKIKIL